MRSKFAEVHGQRSPHHGGHRAFGELLDQEPLFKCRAGGTQSLEVVLGLGPAARQTEEVSVEVKFQACNDQQCLPPKTAKLTGKIPVVPAGEQVKKINDEIFKADTARKESKDGRSAA